ncbi:MAG: hypothetical protein JJU33_06735 [Phycisphaerales bacterium]|nr:hypothetical protein [Phycisphaerales bacterium]
MTSRPQITLRYGAHAEKEYLQRLGGFLDGLLYSGNLLEATQAASVSLLLKVRKKQASPRLYINPMTYIFGPYIDPDSNRKRQDLKWIKSFRKKSQRLEIKDAYQALGAELGEPFKSAIQDSTAVDPVGDLSVDRDAIVEGTLRYQSNRLVDIFTADEEIRQLAGSSVEQLQPSAVFAPYFYCADEWMSAGISANADLARRAVNAAPKAPVHMIACVSQHVLQSRDLTKQLCQECSATGVKAVWLWLSKFDELEASTSQLRKYRALVAELSKSVSVHTYAGGFWSMLLAGDGMEGISHGVGYGERKPVVQVIGAAAPTVRYYFPPIAKRIGVPDIERAFPELGIETAGSFFEEVCECQICKGVIGKELLNFSKFGEMHRSEPNKRPVQTATAAKLCRFHFLVHRLLYEVKAVEACDGDSRADFLRRRAGEWPSQPTVSGEAAHIDRWIESLTGPALTIDQAFAE